MNEFSGFLDRWWGGEAEQQILQGLSIWNKVKQIVFFLQLLVSLRSPIIGEAGSSILEKGRSTFQQHLFSKHWKLLKWSNDQSPLKCRAWWTPPWVGPKRQTHQRGRTHTGSGAYPTTTSPSCSTRMSPFSRTSRYLSESKWFQNMHPGEHPGVSFIQVNKDGRSSCNFEDCPNSPTANVVQTFAGSNEVW